MYESPPIRFKNITTAAFPQQPLTALADRVLEIGISSCPGASLLLENIMPRPDRIILRRSIAEFSKLGETERFDYCTTEIQCIAYEMLSKLQCPSPDAANRIQMAWSSVARARFQNTQAFIRAVLTAAERIIVEDVPSSNALWMFSHEEVMFTFFSAIEDIRKAVATATREARKTTHASRLRVRHTYATIASVSEAEEIIDDLCDVFHIQDSLTKSVLAHTISAIRTLIEKWQSYLEEQLRAAESTESTLVKYIEILRDIDQDMAALVIIPTEVVIVASGGSGWEGLEYVMTGDMAER